MTVSTGLDVRLAYPVHCPQGALESIARRFSLLLGLMEQIELELLLFIRSVYDIMGWWGVVVLMAIESACIPLPSEVVMPLSGWMLVEERGLGSLHTLTAGFYGALGCTVGSAFAYWIGIRGGRPLLERYGRYILVSKRDLDLADRWFGRYGN